MANCVLFSISLMCALFGVLQADCIRDEDINYIIVGSGATGAVIAARLSEIPDNKVLLLEAGGEPLHISNIPLITFLALGTKMDWNYRSVPQTHCCQSFLNESAPQSRGKALGGTTSLNFMTYTRGNRLDYDTWKDLGNDGWGWNDLKDYFMNIEDYQVPMTREDEQYHHKGGPVTVEIPPFKSVLANAFLEMGRELGYPLVDYNGKDQLGFMYPPVTIRKGERCGTYCAYLKPAMGRNNLIVESNALVTKILFDASREHAEGVMYENKDGDKCSVKAKREVIVSGGAYNSPQLLLLSGIGPKKHLDDLNIEVVVNLPGVGQNLQDHVTIGGMMYTTNQAVGMNSVQFETPEYIELWENTKTGPMTVPVSFEGLAFIKTNVSKDDPSWPNIEIFFNTDNSVRIYKPILKQFAIDVIPPDEVNGCTFHPMLLRPKSRGTVELYTSNPHDHPRIDPQYLSHVEDLEAMAEAIELIQNFGKTTALAQYGAQLASYGVFGPCLLDILGGMQPYRRCFARMFSSTGYHPAGTCKMGPDSDDMAVVDNNLRVRGMKNLRVADASVMPNIVAGHPQMACMVIGEKISDMIKKELSAK